MVCPSCGVEAMIHRAETRVTGDTSTEEQTQVWTVLHYRCRNPACGECGKDVGSSESKIYPEERAQE